MRSQGGGVEDAIAEYDTGREGKDEGEREEEEEKREKEELDCEQGRWPWRFSEYWGREI